MSLIKERNKQWEEATVQQRKVMICKDVLDMLPSGSYHVRSSYTYVNLLGPDDLPDTSEEIQEKLLDDDIGCEVCARGAMMLSKMRFKNEYHKTRIWQDGSKVDQGKTARALSDAFTVDELNIIETVFEMRIYASEIFGGYDESLREVGHQKIQTSPKLRKVLSTMSQDDEQRLKDIMERIIACEGDVHKALTCNEGN